MTRTEVIQKFINKYNYQSYLEIGHDTGWNFNAIKCPLKESIDPALGNYSHAKPTYRLTSDEFFSNYPNKKYDIIFIDGLHHSDQVDKDITNSLNSLNEGGVVLLHDCSPPTEESQLVPRNNIRVWCGDVWKSIVKFNYNNFNNYSTYVIDTDLGIGVIEKGKGECSYDLPNLLEYKWLEENRKKVLNLITIDEFSTRI